MTEKPDDPTDPSVPEQTEQRLREDVVGGTVDFEGTSYKITPTAFRLHYQVMTADGRLLGLIEAVDSPSGRTFTARPATGAGMTQQLMIKIADAAAASGIIR